MPISDQFQSRQQIPSFIWNSSIYNLLAERFFVMMMLAFSSKRNSPRKYLVSSLSLRTNPALNGSAASSSKEIALAWSYFHECQLKTSDYFFTRKNFLCLPESSSNCHLVTRNDGCRQLHSLEASVKAADPRH